MTSQKWICTDEGMWINTDFFHTIWISKHQYCTVDRWDVCAWKQNEKIIICSCSKEEIAQEKLVKIMRLLVNDDT